MGFDPHAQPAKPDDAAEQNAELLAERNDDLRAKLAAENESLEAKLAESRAASTDAVGLTDEDVRRIEHPTEFADESA